MIEKTILGMLSGLGLTWILLFVNVRQIAYTVIRCCNIDTMPQDSIARAILHDVEVFGERSSRLGSIATQTYRGMRRV